MNPRSIRVLELPKIIAMLAELVSCGLTRERVLDLEPSGDYGEVRDRLNETDEASALIMRHSSPPFGPVHDLRAHAKISAIGSFLSPGQLMEVSDTLRTARNVKQFITKNAGEGSEMPILKGLADGLVPVKPLEDTINNAILGENLVSDNASHELRKIRREIENKHQAIRNKLDSIIRDTSNQKYLQDALVTIRQDRFVVPVKNEYKHMIKGLVHDQSGSGSTLYIEPFAVVELNNGLKELRLKEQEEIIRILTEITAEVAEVADTLLSNQETLVQLDFILAKGKLAHKMKGTSPELNREGKIRLKNGRHPLIDPKVVVPTNFWIGENFKTLLITGPNTGGKTVTLKTVGLLTLMTQCGLHIPADYGSKIAVFDQVFADIGDEQSIEQSLSTFSSHMTNIVDILNHVDANSLVLFDELGAGTDPTEGAALAKAILTKLFAWKVTTVATTHYSELKEFALVTQGVENASVEFDIETLSPTYKLLIGVPGKSNAFEISRKLGLSKEIIESAKTWIETNAIAFEDVLAKIEYNRKTSEAERDEAVRMRIEAEKLRKSLEEKDEKIAEQRARLIREAKEEARKLLREAKEEADALAKELRDISGGLSKEHLRRVEELRRKLKSNMDDLQTPLLEDLYEVEPPKNLKLGDLVQLVHLNQRGNVVTLPDAGGDLMVQVGIMKIGVNVSNLKKIEEKVTPAKRQSKGGGRGFETKSLNARTEIDLRGLNVEEAMAELDKYLDDACLANLKTVRIIHGIGTGALKAGLKPYFRNHPHVKTARDGAYGEGGIGVTVLELK
ncbi:endonuclease MutS2 [Acidaminobacter sp.]|uniref:endonuclease MutS2 n=1 Tax=Acidaminobacter sp. TaxID=1872102 RepID=UPI002561F564|nr:endonuclease MutS2 [Acidaminobacter sp.]MDK9710287.1 endonuclease MutS2 [Acidaminobacter sp.]